MDTHDQERGGSFETDDDRELEALGYVPSFKREFSNLATVRLCFSLGRRGWVIRFMVVDYLADFRLVLHSVSWYVHFIHQEEKSALSDRLLVSSQGLCSSVATTFNTPLTLGGPSSVRFIPSQTPLQHIQTSVFPCSGHLVLDSWSMHVLYSRYV